MAVLDDLRKIGLPMVSAYPPMSFTTTDEDGEETTVTSRLVLSWTTDSRKADAARDLGATVTSYRAADPAYSGWEVSTALSESEEA